MPSLLLHPASHAWYPTDVNALIGRLQALGFLSENRIPGVSQGYQVGPGFLQLLIFLGCSPQVNLDPADTDKLQNLCFVRLQSFDECVLLSSTPAPQARCRYCRTPARLESTHEFETGWHCGNCGADAHLAELDWRRAAGYGRFFLEVNAVFPHEAVPSEKLLGELGALSGCEWTYFYLNN